MTIVQADFQLLFDEINAFYNNIRALPVQQPISQETIQNHLSDTYSNFTHTLSTEHVIKDVSEMLQKWTVHVTHPQYFGLYNPSVHQVGVLADAMTAAFNPQLAVWSHAPAANEIERMVLNYFMEKLGFDPSTSIANFTSGGAEANLSALTVALTKHFPEYADEGAPQNAIFYGSKESHDSLTKIAHQTGIGRRALHIVPTNASLQLDTQELRRQIAVDIEAGNAPFMVVATAGTTAAGVIDPLIEIADICAEYNLWFHVDAAWGGSAVLSPTLRAYFNGIERADSVTWDAHKWLSVPMGAGMFFCKHRTAVERTYAVSATYMPSETDTAIDPYITTMQWSRRFIGLKVFMTLATVGEQGLIDYIEHQAQMGELLRQKLEASSWSMLNATPLPVVCFSHPRFENDGALLDGFLKRLYGRSKVWISKVSLANGTMGLRACITSFRTDEQDLNVLIDELSHVIQEI